MSLLMEFLMDDFIASGTPGLLDHTTHTGVWGCSNYAALRGDVSA
ncbi:MAG: hypothetical protein ABJG41_01275 [Cyclobacteriaceae bacterium]